MEESAHFLMFLVIFLVTHEISCYRKNSYKMLMGSAFLAFIFYKKIQ